MPQAILVLDWSMSKIFFSETAMPKWTELWLEAPMEGSVLSLLKAEWKVSDTGSAHWASSYIILVIYFRHDAKILAAKKPAYPYSSDESDAAALNPKQQFGVTLLQ